MSITHMATVWMSAAQRHCSEYGLVYLRADQLNDFVHKGGVRVETSEVRGLGTEPTRPLAEAEEADAHMRLIAHMVALKTSPVAICPELTVNGVEPGSNLIPGTCNLRLYILISVT